MHNYNMPVHKGRTLIYDPIKSEGMIVPIYHDVDGQLYMPLDNRFVTVNEVISALEEYLAGPPAAI